MNKIIAKIINENIGELITLIGLSIFIYTMFLINVITGLITLSVSIFLIGLLVSKIYNPS